MGGRHDNAEEPVLVSFFSGPADAGPFFEQIAGERRPLRGIDRATRMTFAGKSKGLAQYAGLTAGDHKPPGVIDVQDRAALRPHPPSVVSRISTHFAVGKAKSAKLLEDRARAHWLGHSDAFAFLNLTRAAAILRDRRTQRQDFASLKPGEFCATMASFLERSKSQRLK
ncbi:hypothetical protein ACNHKD_05735 [Methylocystis sp. JAN1]|uniref:hypothetical protein n=1 Tax=Methylocystis sp. JAN1 TaxID=3397211 RepID=UPI003FA2CD66